jgi:hypothetical protein
MWPLLGLRQSFLNGSLTRLIDPDKVLKIKIPEFVEKGEFGLASGNNPDGSYINVWFKESISPEEVTFEKDVFLLRKEKAEKLKSTKTSASGPITTPIAEAFEEEQIISPVIVRSTDTGTVAQLQISGTIPPEIWNRFGSRILPKVRNLQDLLIDVTITMNGTTEEIARLQLDLNQALSDLGLAGQVEIKQV